MAGWDALGDILGGGAEAARQKGFVEGRYRSAQTEAALANAREGQAKAIQQERTNAIMEKVAATQGIPPEAMLGELIAAGAGADYSAVQSGRVKGQEYDLRSKIADPATDYATIQRNRAAIGDTPFNPLDAVGTRGSFMDARDPDAGVQKPIGEELFPTDPTPAITNFEYSQTLPPEKRAAFDPYVRNAQIITAGGVPVNTGLGGAGPARPVVSRDETAANAGAIAGAKTMGQGEAKRTLDLPAAKQRLATTDKGWDEMSGLAKKIQSDDALWQRVGIYQAISAIPGTDGARIRGQLNTLKSKVGLQVIMDMKNNSKTGGALGQVSNFELETVQNAIAALDANLAPDDFREQLQVLIDYAEGAKQRTSEAFLETYPELAAPTAPPVAAPGAAQAKAALPPKNAQGWELMTDGQGNQAYVSPDKTQFEEVP